MPLISYVRMLAVFFLPESFLDFLSRDLITYWWISIDWWIFIHLFSGLILGLLVKRRWLALVLIVGFEVFERYLMGISLITGEVWADTVWDIIVGYAGFELARFAKKRIMKHR